MNVEEETVSLIDYLHAHNFPFPLKDISPDKKFYERDLLYIWIVQMYKLDSNLLHIFPDLNGLKNGSVINTVIYFYYNLVLEAMFK